MLRDLSSSSEVYADTEVDIFYLHPSEPRRTETGKWSASPTTWTGSAPVPSSISQISILRRGLHTSWPRATVSREAERAFARRPRARDEDVRPVRSSPSPRTVTRWCSPTRWPLALPSTSGSPQRSTGPTGAPVSRRSSNLRQSPRDIRRASALESRQMTWPASPGCPWTGSCATLGRCKERACWPSTPGAPGWPPTPGVTVRGDRRPPTSTASTRQDLLGCPRRETDVAGGAPAPPARPPPRRSGVGLGPTSSPGRRHGGHLCTDRALPARTTGGGHAGRTRKRQEALRHALPVPTDDLTARPDPIRSGRDALLAR